MERKAQKNIIVGLFFLLAVLAVVIFWYYRDTILQQDNQSHSQRQQQQFAIEDKQITDDTKPLKVAINYPFINGSQSFNDAVKNIIDGEVNSFKKDALETDALMKQNDPQGYQANPRTYEFDITYDKAMVDDHTASIVFQIFADTGGAHPNGYYRSLTYDLKDNKEITLADVFQGQADYVKKISDFCMQDLKKQIMDRIGSTQGFWLDDGAGPKVENFSVFLLDSSTITFYFPPYQVGPYVAGSFQVAMPR